MKSPVVHIPTSKCELLEYLLLAPEDTLYLAGGTDLMIHLHLGLELPRQVIYLKHVDEMASIEEWNDFYDIGAVCTFDQIEKSYTLKNQLPALTQSASLIGSAQIRNMATIGGNVANDSPAADATVAMLVLNAQVAIMDKSGAIEWQLLRDFLANGGTPLLLPGQVIWGFRIPKQFDNDFSVFKKLGSRSSFSISQLSLGISLRTDPTMTKVQSTFVALGAVGERPYLIDNNELQLNDIPFSSDFRDKLACLLSSEISRSIKTRQSMPYKRRAIEGLVDDAFNYLLGKRKERIEENMREEQ